MAPKLTRRGARNVTSTADDLMDLYQNHYATLGLPKDLALDIATKMDIVSDLIELRAASNFPLDREAADAPVADDIADDIGGDVDGPKKQDSDEPYMDGEFSQEENHELRDRQESGSLPEVDKAAAAYPALLKEFGKAAGAAWTADATYENFSGRIAELDALRTATEELAAEVVATCAGITADTEAGKAIATVRDALVEETRKQASEISNTRSTLVQAGARVRVSEVDSDASARVAGATAQFDGRIAAFIAEAKDMLAEQRAVLAAFIEGAGLLQVTDRTAALQGLAVRFEAYVASEAKGLARKLAAATEMIAGSAEDAFQASDEFLRAFNDAPTAPRLAAEDEEVEIEEEVDAEGGKKAAEDDEDEADAEDDGDDVEAGKKAASKFDLFA